MAAALGLYSVVIAWIVQHDSEVVRALLLAHVLPAAGLWALSILARRNRDPLGFALLGTALVLKVLAAGPRYLTLVLLYGGSGDSARYDSVGRGVATTLRSGSLEVSLAGRVPGTGFIELLTGAIYSTTGPSLVGGFLVYSFIGFWGLYLFYRAFVIAVPDGNHRRYGLLVLFMPSLVFWPSSIGKEAWMMLCLGLAAYGAASIGARRRAGLVLLVTGLTGCCLVRPHMALLVVMGLAGAVMLQSRSQRRWTIRRLAMVAVTVVAAVVVLRQVQRFFGDSSLNEAISLTQTRSAGGESTFDAPGSSVLGIPLAVISVLLRPFPWEARNPQSLLIAMEGVVLVGLAWTQRAEVRVLVRRIRENPYITLCLLYTLFFCVAFANIGNFGNLARQRSQLYPFVFALLTMGTAAAGARGGDPPGAEVSIERSQARVGHEQADAARRRARSRSPDVMARGANG